MPFVLLQSKEKSRPSELLEVLQILGLEQKYTEPKAEIENVTN
jgi:hypothetical protein